MFVSGLLASARVAGVHGRMGRTRVMLSAKLVDPGVPGYMPMFAPVHGSDERWRLYMASEKDCLSTDVIVLSPVRIKYRCVLARSCVMVVAGSA